MRCHSEPFRRATKAAPCPVCQHGDWCGVSPDGAVAVCMRMDSGKVARNGGWVHVLAERQPGTRRNFTPVPIAPKRLANAAALCRRWQAATEPWRLADLAGSLGVGMDALSRLGAGWAPEYEAWAFPMCDGDAVPVGVRLRDDLTGRKWAVTGSGNALFIPAQLTGATPLLICEGPTDTAAALTLGFDAIGRPQCRGCVDPLAWWLKRNRHGVLVVVPDNDELKGNGERPGIDGAVDLAEKLAVPLRMAVPPCKDLRQWLRAGATQKDVFDLIGNSKLLNGRK